MIRLADLVNVAVVAGIVFAAWQVLVARAQARANFEQLFVQQYRDVVARIPLEALLGEAIDYKRRDPGECGRSARRAFYDYFELCEDELFYAKRQRPWIRRVSRRTWRDWEAGIRTHLALPAFRSAWDDISAAVSAERFTELRRWIAEQPACRSNSTSTDRAGAVIEDRAA